MGLSPQDRLSSVQAMIGTAPDDAVRSLELALCGEGPGEALSSIRTLVRAELADRAVRDSVLGPILPLCAPRPDGFAQALFPAGVLTRLWRALKQMEPLAVSLAAASLKTPDEEAWSPDGLCRAAAAALREGRAEMAEVRRYLEEFRAGAALQLAGFLALAPLARGAIRRLPAWLHNMNSDHVAMVRVLFKDAQAVSPDALPGLMEMLMAQLREPWAILRIVSAATRRAGDRYISASELAGFGERVLADIDRRVALAQAFDLEGGAEGGAAAAKALNGAVVELVEMEESLDLSREGPWGARVARQKAAVAALAEACLRKCPKALGEALPLQLSRAGGATRWEPKVGAPPDPARVDRAMAALAFYDRSRDAAGPGGFGAARQKAGEELIPRLNSYVEDVLLMLHGGHARHARLYLDMAADMTALALDDASARIVRRRAAAA